MGAAIASMPPLGQLYIATYLQQKGYEVQIWDLAVERMKKKEFIVCCTDGIRPVVFNVEAIGENDVDIE